MGIHRVDGSGGGEPNTWKVEHFANIGASEEFVCQLAIEMPDLVGATKIIDPQERQEVIDAIGAISFEGLMPAFEHLKRIRSSSSARLPILDRKQLYDDLSRTLWVAYKTLAQKAAKQIGPDLGFLFQNDNNFETGAEAFRRGWPTAPDWFVPYLREQRTKWQNDLSTFRNFLEHASPAGDYSARYTPSHAEKLFDAVWRTIANILAALLGMHIAPVELVEIPVNERRPGLPRRFGFAVPGISAPEEFERLFRKVGPAPVPLQTT